MKKLLLSVFLLAAVLAGCEKIDYDKLEGTKWESVTEEFIYTLHFVDESECTIATTGNDLTQWIDVTTYSWRHVSAVDSQWGLFLLEDSEGKPYAAGTVENKTLYLQIYTEDVPLVFKRK